jgi:hypothetical protein
MRIAFHDYPGHAFPVQLARALARRGHAVLYLHFAEFQSPKGALAPARGDPPGLRLQPIGLGQAHRKYDLVQRWLQDRRYGARLVEQVRAFRPDVVLGGNAPLDPQARCAPASCSGCRMPTASRSTSSCAGGCPAWARWSAATTAGWSVGCGARPTRSWRSPRTFARCSMPPASRPRASP